MLQRQVCRQLASMPRLGWAVATPTSCSNVAPSNTALTSLPLQGFKCSYHADLLLACLQGLPDDVKIAHEHSASSYSVGWSHGKEALRSGQKDIHKGSFYANPVQVSVQETQIGTLQSSRAASALLMNTASSCLIQAASASASSH